MLIDLGSTCCRLIRFFLGYFTLGCSVSRLSAYVVLLAYWERLDRPVPTEQSIALYADWNRSKETEVLPLAASNTFERATY